MKKSSSSTSSKSTNERLNLVRTTEVEEAGGAVAVEATSTELAARGLVQVHLVVAQLLAPSLSSLKKTKQISSFS